MSDPVKQFREMAEDTPYPATKACDTCNHAPDNLGCAIARCHATNNYIDMERVGISEYGKAASCGPEGKLWEPISPRPPDPPRLGLIGWIKRLLVGDQP